MEGPKCSKCMVEYQVDGDRRPVLISMCGHSCCLSCHIRLVQQVENSPASNEGHQLFKFAVENSLMIDQLKRRKRGIIDTTDYSKVVVTDVTYITKQQLLGYMTILIRIGFFIGGLQFLTTGDWLPNVCFEILRLYFLILGLSALVGTWAATPRYKIERCQ